MREVQAIVKNSTGLHARPAAAFVREAARFRSKINIECGGRRADGKSILQVLSLGVKCGSVIVIRGDGEDEDTAVERLVRLVEGELVEEA